VEIFRLHSIRAGDDLAKSTMGTNYYLEDSGAVDWNGVAMLVYLGKRSGGWMFCWNFHDNEYYSTRSSLVAFIRSGVVVCEGGYMWETESFLLHGTD